MHYFFDYLPSILAALFIAVIGISLAHILKKICMRWIKKTADQTIQSFIINFVYIVVLVLVGIIALSKLGVPTASLITLLGAASLAVGLALKNFLSNIAAGFVIIFLRPFKIGDYIDIDGCLGTVADINLFVIQMQTMGNEALFIPNNKVVSGCIINFSRYPSRRLNFSVGISYDSDIQQAKSVLKQLLTENGMVHNQPEPLIAVQKLADSAIEIIVRAWVNRENYLAVKFELLESIKQRFDKMGITIPYPQTDVHLKYDKKEKETNAPPNSCQAKR